MLLNSKKNHSATATILVLLLTLPQAATATVVEVETDLGTNEINLYDKTTLRPQSSSSMTTPPSALPCKR